MSHSCPRRASLVRLLHRHPTAAAGTRAGARAWRWLQGQSAAVKCICGLVVDTDAERFRTLLTSLPALESISEPARSGLTLRPHPGAAAAATQDFLAGAARAIGRCSCLRCLQLLIEVGDELWDRVPGSLWQHLAEARALENLSLTIRSGVADPHDGLATTHVSHLITGLAGLSRLRTLTLSMHNVCEGAALPACVSRLVQLTSLTLSGLGGLRCAPGWARLPALVHLEFEECEFAADGEDALPGMDALVSLTEFEVFLCPGLLVLPASLWQLTRLSNISVWRACDEPPTAGPPASAPCFASLTSVTLVGHQLRYWPACVQSMRRLTDLDMRDNSFEELPEAVSVLTALETLCLGRHCSSPVEVGGTLDARALGNLAGFPNLRSLEFNNCCVQFCPSFQAAAAHPCLKKLELDTSHPAPGPSRAAFLGFVAALLQQGRAGVLKLTYSIDQGAGEHECQDFRGVLQAVGFPLHDVC